MQASTRTDDPAYRKALEAAVLPWPARSSRVLWHDAAMLARADGSRQIKARHLRQALSLQYAAAEAIAERPDWTTSARLVYERCSGPHCADRLGA
jgi:hypothetical protein